MIEETEEPRETGAAAGPPPSGEAAPPPAAPSVAAVQPDDPAPWGLRGAIVVTALSLGAQVALAILLGGLAWIALTSIDPNLAGHPDELRELMLLVTVVPLALLSSMFTVGLVYVSITAQHHRPFLASLRLSRPRLSSFGGYMALGYGVALLYVALTVLAPMPEVPEKEGPLARLAQSGPLGHLLWMMLAMVMAPVVEEILFRGYAYLGARRALGPAGAGIAVTMVFVALHTTETGGYWPALAGIATLAALLVTLMERTGNLAYCVACHLGYNAALATLSWLGT